MGSFYDENCPFCPANEKVDIIAETDGAYLTQVRTQAGEAVVGRYFIIPKEHLISYFSLPDNWTSQVKTLLQEIKPGEYLEDFNLSWNFGFQAGQRLEHLHLWVIFRLDALDIGLGALIDEVADRRRRESRSVLGVKADPPDK